MMTGLQRQRNLPQIAFVDEELFKELDKKFKGNSKSEEIFVEHEFIASCLRIGLSISDLKELTYVDVMKILLSFIQDSKPQKNMATQSDIDKLLG